MNEIEAETRRSERDLCVAELIRFKQRNIGPYSKTVIGECIQVLRTRRMVLAEAQPERTDQ